jgi:hypothetical protein
MKALLLTIISILVSFAASFANIQWFAILAAIGAVVGAYAQYKDSQPFEFRFGENAWEKNGLMFELVVPKRQHGKTHPTTTVYEAKLEAFEEIGCDISTGADGKIVICVS